MEKQKIHPFEYAILSLVAEENPEAKAKLETVEPYTQEEIFQQRQDKLRETLSRIKFKGE